MMLRKYELTEPAWLLLFLVLLATLHFLFFFSLELSFELSDLWAPSLALGTGKFLQHRVAHSTAVHTIKSWTGNTSMMLHKYELTEPTWLLLFLVLLCCVSGLS